MEYKYFNDKPIRKPVLRNPYNVDGPFYTQDACIVCGAPGMAAPELIKFTDDAGMNVKDGDDHYGCVVVKQPTNLLEVKTIIEAMNASCVSCLRYCGNDPTVINLIKHAGLSELIDK